MTASNTVGANDRVIIFDTTLRDGEQCPGASMTFEEKLEVAEVLDEMGVDVIEAGFPLASIGDFESVAEIARRTKNATIAGLSRAALNDIDRCAEAVKHARRGRIHTFLSTSPVHMKYKLQKEPHEVLVVSASSMQAMRVAATALRMRLCSPTWAWANHELQPPRPPARRSEPIDSEETEPRTTGVPAMLCAFQVILRMGGGAAGSAGRSVAAGVSAAPWKLTMIRIGAAGAIGSTG